MRVAGGIALVVAMVFFCLAIMLAASTVHMQKQVDEFSGFEKAAQSWTGVDKRNQAQIDGTKIGAGMCLLSSVLTGGLGAVLIGVSFVKKRG